MIAPRLPLRAAVCDDLGLGGVPPPPGPSPQILAAVEDSAEDERTSRRKPWRFYGAQAVTSARSAGGFRGQGLTLFRNAQTTIDAVSREADEYPRHCGTFADAITDLGGI